MPGNTLSQLKHPQSLCEAHEGAVHDFMYMAFANESVHVRLLMLGRR
jgi:hypothetical protein